MHSLENKLRIVFAPFDLFANCAKKVREQLSNVSNVKTEHAIYTYCFTAALADFFLIVDFLLLE